MATTTPAHPQPASAPRSAPNAPRPAAPDTKVKRLSFAFPFLKKGARPSDAAAKFTDEHEIYQLLSGHEPSGNFLVSDKGMWHGGIHITDTGVGAKLDLNQGVRCIADGDVIAYRINRTYPMSELPATNGQPARQVPYSTGFALVRHTMEFPKGTLLTFYSLYMHLQAFADYEQDTSKAKPPYLSTQWKVTECAQDKPKAGRNGQAADASQQGLNVRASAPKGRRGEVTAILGQGAQVTLSERKGNWGKVKDAHGATLYAPSAGAVVPASAVGGWIFLGNEHGGPVAKEVMPDEGFDRVVVTVSASGEANTTNAQGIPIKAGELIGHLGSYDSLNAGLSSTRMAHIEVFCDESIKAFIGQGREWLRVHGASKDDWKPLGLSSDPTLLRVNTDTKLYQAAEREGANAPKTGVVQRWSLGELARDRNNQSIEATADRSGRKVNWWRVASADATRQPIVGWVREEGFAGGSVTREFAQKWVDFAEPIDEAHDAAHTMFATTKGWVDYRTQASVPDVKAEAKLSPLMKKVYRALFAQGEGSRAADDLCNAFEGSTEGYPWMMLAASRLIVKHESEWANPEKWKQLYAEAEQIDGAKPQYKEEQKRIEKLVFWDELKAKVPGFPGPSVYHIHPIGLVGNFALSCDCQTRFDKISSLVLQHEGGYVNDPADSGGATNMGIAWPTWQAHAQEDVGVAPTLVNLKALTVDQAKTIYFKRYWEPRGFCGIKNEYTALNIYDWTITSGQAIRKIQEMLNGEYSLSVPVNNRMTDEFVETINSIEDQNGLVQHIAEVRRSYYRSLTIGRDRKPNKNEKFLGGWLNRVNSCVNFQG